MADNKQKTDFGWKLENSYAQLPNMFFTQLNPWPVRSPELAVFNDTLAADLGLRSDALKTEEGIAMLAGNQIPEGAAPLAQAYAGHQFGSFNILGDGRAVLLGEQLTPQGARYDIQLKGSGRTPYSRGGDGRAALGPMLREFIISEAMYALGIPTSRSLAVVATGEDIARETYLPGAVLTRVAASHLRFGTFQFAAYKGEIEDRKALADYAINRHYPELESVDNKYLAFLQEVAKRQAALVAKWMGVGFIHGVMNTDNMTISGESIDYGPCAFMDRYDPATVFSSIDEGGRYAYGNQPQITGWNLARFAETLLPLLSSKQEEAIEMAQQTLDGFIEAYQANWLDEMRRKIGLFTEEPEDGQLIKQLLSIMKEAGADYTNLFRALTFGTVAETVLAGTRPFNEWDKAWQERLSRQPQRAEEVHELMKNSNPGVIPRNHRVEEALDAAVQKGDYSVMERLLEALAEPYAHKREHQPYTEPPADPDNPYQTFCGT
ncbi:MAG TPA: YdiU family protein [Planococcus sp. (in: firmicutes)]|nr:YdiU family protein [Planococcus sp. (in: firmicutes)]